MPRKILFTQWFNGTVEVQTYNLYCLYKNLCNPALDQVVLFIDDPHFQNIFGDKLVPVPWGRRLTYNDWFDHSQRHYPDEIKILANSDIFLNESLARVDVLDWANTLHVLSRRDITPDSKIRRSSVLYGGTQHINPKWSQDCWMYKTPLPKLTKEIYVGVMHCENHMRENLQAQGVKLNNLTGRVDCLHLDWRANKPRTMADYALVKETKEYDHPVYAFE